jgi:integrating conjugative element membrane protein (TIGR03745 family)
MNDNMTDTPNAAQRDATPASTLTRSPAPRWQHGIALLTGLFISGGQALAALPVTAPPSRGAAAGNYIQMMQDYAYDIFLFLGLAVAVLAFFVVSKNTIGAYGEVQDGKGTWGQLGVNFGAGVLLLVFVVYLLTEAAAIL